MEILWEVLKTSIVSPQEHFLPSPSSRPAQELRCPLQSGSPGVSAGRTLSGDVKPFPGLPAGPGNMHHPGRRHGEGLPCQDS